MVPRDGLEIMVTRDDLGTMVTSDYLGAMVPKADSGSPFLAFIRRQVG